MTRELFFLKPLNLQNSGNIEDIGKNIGKYWKYFITQIENTSFHTFSTFSRFPIFFDFIALSVYRSGRPVGRCRGGALREKKNKEVWTGRASFLRSGAAHEEVEPSLTVRLGCRPWQVLIRCRRDSQRQIWRGV